MLSGSSYHVITVGEIGLCCFACPLFPQNKSTLLNRSEECFISFLETNRKKQNSELYFASILQTKKALNSMYASVRSGLDGWSALIRNEYVWRRKITVVQNGGDISAFFCRWRWGFNFLFWNTYLNGLVFICHILITTLFQITKKFMKVFVILKRCQDKHLGPEMLCHHHCLGIPRQWWSQDRLI